MSLGRISGPLLRANLERDTDLAFDTDLLYIGHTDGKIGITTSTRPRDFTVPGTLKVRNAGGQDLAISQTLNIGNFTIGPDNISSLTQNIEIGSAGKDVTLAGFRTSQGLYIDDNQIGSYTTNTDISVIPNGTGTVEIVTAGKTVTVDGNVHATGNITFDGSIFIGGTGGEDNLRIFGDLDSNLMPDATGTYDIGESARRFNYNTENLTVDSVINAENVTIDGIEVTLSQGNIYYVAVNGNDTKRGTNPQ